MNLSRRLYHTLAAVALLSLLALAACGSQASNGETNPASPPSPTPIPPTNTPVPTSTPRSFVPPTPPAGALLGGNIIVNGNAEQGMCALNASTVITPIVGWTPTGNITPIRYDADGGDLSATTPGPSDAGNCYFWGGSTGAMSSMTQTDDVSAVAALIDSNIVSYDLSGWLGGYAEQNDNAVLSIQFLGMTGNVLGTATIGPVLAVDRNRTSELLFRSTTGKVPVGTRSIMVTLTMTRTDGSDNDGCADDLSLYLVQPGGSGSSTPATTPTP